MISDFLYKRKALFAPLQIIIPMWFTFALFIFTLFFIFVPSMNNYMMDQKKELIQELAFSAWSLLSDYNDRVSKGEMTLPDAQARAINKIRNMRYGPEAKDYFWINDMFPKMIMHPYFPEMEGKELTSFADVQGQYLFVDSVRIVKENGAGYMDYLWQWKDNPDRVVEKLSYVKGFSPWGWIIGTGIYIDDVRIEIDRILKKLTTIIVSLSCIIFILTLYISWQAVRSEKKRTDAEEALRESEERYRLLANNATDNIWILQLSSYKLSYMSPSVENTLGYTPEEMLDLDFKDYISYEMVKNINDLISGELEIDNQPGLDPKRARTLQLEQVKKDGLKIWAEITACFLRDDKGVPDRVLGITRDITLRKRLEQQINQSHKMEAIGTLASGIAHDFNNILSSLIGFTELVKMSTAENEEVQENLEHVLSAGIRARDLVKHIMLFGRSADLQEESIHLSPLIEECLKFIRASIPKYIEIKKNLIDENFNVTADPSQIHQIIMNLFTNAAQSMKKNGGLLDVQLNVVETDATGMSHIESLEDGKYLKLTVADTGCGIPKNVIDRIFDPFFTTKKREEGTGLGLSTVHGIIKNLGGAISVCSEIDKGTIFQVFLPAHESAPLSNVVENQVLKRGVEKILFVDDETNIILSGKQILESLGYDVVGVTSSVEALELFKENIDQFDLILTDMTMPQMTGIELANQIFAIKPDMAIVLCTGFSEAVTSKVVQDTGIIDVVMKPIIKSELSAILNKALNKNEVS